MGRTPTMARFGWGGVALLGLGAAAALGLAPAGPPSGQQSEGQPASTEPAPERVVVFCRDGRRIEGRLVRQSPREVVLEIAGIETSFNAEDILRVDAVPPVEEHYRRLRSVVADEDIEQRLVLIDWLRDRESYSLALKEVIDLLEAAPGNDDAERLKLQIESEVMLRAEAAKNEPSERDTRDHEPAARRPDFPVLSPDQINLLKVYEVDLDDPPRMTVDRETIRDLIQAYEGHELIPQTREGRAALERRPASYILELMFRLKARDFYNRVRVEGEPEAFGKFRDDVHRAWIVNSCATTACHGGQQAGRLWLANTSVNAEKAIYTNFLILERYRLADGTPLIDYENPARSPLLQLALPREESLYPHPLVATSRSAAWRPVIGSVDDLRFREALAWIDAMYRPRPDYPVTYEPPKPDGGVPVMPSDPIGER